jgi:F-box-like
MPSSTMPELCSAFPDPPEILEMIFGYLLAEPDDFSFKDKCHKLRDPRHLLTKARDLWLARINSADLRDGRHRLLPVALVCRHWNNVATKMLYTQIDLKGLLPLNFTESKSIAPRNSKTLRVSFLHLQIYAILFVVSSSAPIGTAPLPPVITSISFPIVR